MHIELLSHVMLLLTPCKSVQINFIKNMSLSREPDDVTIYRYRYCKFQNFLH